MCRDPKAPRILALVSKVARTRYTVLSPEAYHHFKNDKNERVLENVQDYVWGIPIFLPC